MPIPEVQRLLARGPGTLPDVLLVDVGALIRWGYDEDPNADIWPAVLEAGQRTHRRLMWIVAGTAVPHPALDPATLGALGARLAAAFGAASVLRSHEPLPALLAAVAAPGDRVGVVTAGLDNRPYEMWLLDDGKANALVDVATGQIWTHADAGEHLGDPYLLPFLYAIVGTEPGSRPIVREARNYVEVLRLAAVSGTPFEDADVPPRVKKALVDNKNNIEVEARRLRGEGLADPAARAWLRSWLDAPSPLESVRETPRTTYVLAELDRAGGAIVFKRVSVQHGVQHRAVAGHGPSLSLLKSAVQDNPDRWFVPHALDVLGGMADHGLVLPSAAVDPAYVAFALRPDMPLSVTDRCTAALSLSTAARRWLEDAQRNLPFPNAAPDWNDLIEILPILDRNLSGALRQEGLDDLLEHDIGPTLPVLAKLERQGAWIDIPAGYPSWDHVRRKLERRLRFLQKTFMPLFSDLDPYRAEFRELVGLLKRKYGLIPSAGWSPELSAEDEFNRYVVLDAPEAVALDRARSIATSAFYWQSSLQQAGGRLRGVLAPTATGRWSFHDLPLHNLPKKSIEGQLFRSALRAPPGYILIGCDYNAFEARLLAALSGDPALVVAANAADMHAEMAKHLSGTDPGSISRDDAKVGVYAIIYGQSLKGFRRRQATFTHQGSTELYQRVEATVASALAYRHAELGAFAKNKYVKTRGGWRRWAPTKRAAFNTLIQGLGADILRRVLRELDWQLAGTDAFIVHQAHDEVIVASRPACADHVAQILEGTMKNMATQAPRPLLPRPVPLHVKIHRGDRWADLL
ncbi:hypothetical protein KEG38_23575 [Polyangium jinanense]|uniref:DNA polymerase n=1 Tax=Polyangium jinanense TaxID=2829994 RepID=UPI0023418A5A|nr:DNA polymerase [Polyangium jinanense]MDC3956860.1 hypothetical protein [Polyangium jinanense]